MLTISKGDRVPLPKTYHDINNICASIYDHLTEILSDSYYSSMSTTDIDFNGDEELKKRFQSKPIAALEAAGCKEELEIVLTKHLVMSLISDMGNFIYEALSNARRGKMSVAFALLRKPFTDQLLILEQILVDRKGFIESFYHNGNPIDYDPSAKSLKKDEIIKAAIEKLNTVKMFDGDLFYRMRYDKSLYSGINWISNHALHIVTRDKQYATSKQSFNFIFSGKNDVKKYWKHFYRVVPYLLIYTAAIIDEIVFDFIEDPQNRKGVKSLKRLIAIDAVINKKRENDSLSKALADIFSTECEHCKSKSAFIDADFNLYFYEDIFICSNCFNLLPINKDVFALFGKNRNSNL